MSMENRRKWTDEEIKYLKDNYGIKTLVEISDKLGRTQQSIRAFASRNQIYAHYWTEEETEYLIEKYGIMSNKKIAKKLGKTVSAIYNKAHGLNLGNKREQSERINQKEVRKLLGFGNDYKIKKWISEGLKTYKLGMYVMIDPDDLTNWMKTHQDEWSAMACEKYYFDNYKWFHDKLLKEREEAHQKRWRGISA